MFRHHLTKFIFLINIALCFVLPSNAQSSKPYTNLYNLENDIAIQGYDPVAYFVQHKPMKGNKKFQFNFQGVIYYFSSQQNLLLFKQTPAKFEPQYGGWCAYAMGKSGEKVEVDPETYKILDGKLYLFYNAYFNNTLKLWNKNEAKLKANADINWLKFLNIKK